MKAILWLQQRNTGGWYDLVLPVKVRSAFLLYHYVL